MMFPSSGFRVRREYRRINDWERMMFHEAVNTLKMVSVYKMQYMRFYASLSR